jgi:hypothetical protein
MSPSDTWHISKRQLAIGLALFALAVIAYAHVFWADYRLHFNAASVMGQPEAYVVKKLGAPSRILSATEIAGRSTEQWWGTGWTPAPKRAVTNKVLLYHAVISGALVFIGPEGTVEHVHLIGT